jgi:hypothetical protein
VTAPAGRTISEPRLPVPVSEPDSEADWRTTAAWCFDRRHLLNTRDVEFVKTLLRWNGQPSPRQLRWLADIALRLRRKAA